MRPILSMAWVRGYWYVHFTASISWPSGLTARKDEFEVKRLPLQGENTDTGVCELPCRVTAALKHTSLNVTVTLTLTEGSLLSGAGKQSKSKTVPES